MKVELIRESEFYILVKSNHYFYVDYNGLLQTLHHKIGVNIAGVPEQMGGGTNWRE